MSLKGTIFDITRGSLHDGPGIRTVVYMKGCNMRCRWCQNPEGFRTSKQLLYYRMRCIGCGRCAALCPEHHLATAAGHDYLASGCTVCGRCAESCPAGALEICGTEYDAEALMKVLLKDAHYFRRGGGVSFSGGECLLQSEFLSEVFKRCHREGISVLVESALNVPWQSVERVLEDTDLFYIDVKHMDAARHREFTGVGNELILENIKRLSRLHSAITIRTPLIPGVNDDGDNLMKTVELAIRIGAAGYQLLRYNPLAKNKYERAFESYTSFGHEPQTPEYMTELCSALNRTIQTDKYVFWKA